MNFSVQNQLNQPFRKNGHCTPKRMPVLLKACVLEVFFTSQLELCNRTQDRNEYETNKQKKTQNSPTNMDNWQRKKRNIEITSYQRTVTRKD